ncbi:hypothetical protein AGMMS4957_12370 [Bacteroidia bacterium]|nr:hypothetical protein AGMMS4957_12370 [Bacteroidia bacterium]
MKKVMNLVVAALAMIAVSSCAEGGSNSPADIEKSIYSQFQKGNFEMGMELYFDNIEKDDASNSDASSDERQQAVKEFAQKTKQTVEAKGGIKDFEVLEEAIAEDGETAMVHIKITYGDGSEQPESRRYVKKDGQWKIVFGK